MDNNEDASIDKCFGGGIREIINGFYTNAYGTKGKHVLDESNEQFGASQFDTRVRDSQDTRTK